MNYFDPMTWFNPDVFNPVELMAGMLTGCALWFFVLLPVARHLGWWRY